MTGDRRRLRVDELIDASHDEGDIDVADAQAMARALDRSLGAARCSVARAGAGAGAGPAPSTGRSTRAPTHGLPATSGIG